MEWIIAVVGARTTAQDGANFTVRQAMSEPVWLAAHPRLHICLPIVQTLSGCLSARPSFRFACKWSVLPPVLPFIRLSSLQEYDVRLLIAKREVAAVKGRYSALWDVDKRVRSF